MEPIKTYIRIKGPESPNYDIPLPTCKIFTHSTTLTDLEEITSPLLKKFNSGYSSALLCYGQSGSGKSFSTQQILKILTQKTQNCEFAHLEILGDQLKDLITLDVNLKVLQDNSVQNLTFHSGDSVEFERLNQTANRNRRSEKTNLNSNSSRSHHLIIFRAPAKNLFILADLAGSERCEKAQTSGKQLQDGSNINFSLLVLGRVVNALRKGDFAPFRDSKLTMVLKNALGGNSCTGVLGCVSGDKSNSFETLSTFEFISRVSGIKNKVEKVVVRSGNSNSQLIQENLALQEKYDKLLEQSRGIVQSLLKKAKEREETLKGAFKRIYEGLVAANQGIIAQQDCLRNQVDDMGEIDGDQDMIDLMGFLGVKDDEK